MDLPIFNISWHLNSDADLQNINALNLKVELYKKLLGNSLSNDIKEFIIFEIREWVDKISEFHMVFEDHSEFAEYHQTSNYPGFNIRATMQVYNKLV
jgi:hypothetical protein